MYVITHHHDYDEVLLGPIDWNPRFIASVIRSDLELESDPVIKDSDRSRIPYDIVENVRIRPVNFVRPDYEPRTQFLVGPYWTYTENEATATYNVQYKDINIVRAEIKQEVSALRYSKEISGTKVTLQGKEVSLTTNRTDREIYAQKYLLMNDSDTIEWKFSDGWMTLTKSEMSDVVNAVNNHVQSTFSWELAKSMELDDAITHEELISVKIYEE